MEYPNEEEKKWFTNKTYGEGNLSNCKPAKNKIQWKGSTIPNCMGCAIGLFNEDVSKQLGKDGWYYSFRYCSPSKTLIEKAKAQGLNVSNDPQEKAMIVWVGHIAYVDEVLSDQKIRITESAWSGSYIWRTREISNLNGRWERNETFLGFIYNPFIDYGRPKVHPAVLIVAEGDTWMTISEEYYGNRFQKRNAVKLALYNGRKITDELKVGERIWIE